MFAWLHRSHNRRNASAQTARTRLMAALSDDRARCAPEWETLVRELTELFSRYAELDEDGLRLLMGRRKTNGQPVITASVGVKGFRAQPPGD